MTKVAYNACYGGFGLSHEAVMRYAELKGITLYHDHEQRWGAYYRVPVEEYNKQYEIDEQNRNYTLSNEMYFSTSNIYENRSDPILIQVIEELGKKANGMCADLAIEDLPAGTRYRITEYDGYEGVETADSVDWNVA